MGIVTASKAPNVVAVSIVFVVLIGFPFSIWDRIARFGVCDSFLNRHALACSWGLNAPPDIFRCRFEDFLVKNTARVFDEGQEWATDPFPQILLETRHSPSQREIADINLP